MNSNNQRSQDFIKSLISISNNLKQEDMILNFEEIVKFFIDFSSDYLPNLNKFYDNLFELAEKLH